MESALTIALSLGLLIGALLVTRRLGARWGLHAEVQRKIVHVGLGLYALTFPLIFDQPWEVITLCILAAALLIAARVLPGVSGSLGGALHGVKRDSFGELLFALSIALLFLLSEGKVVLYVLPLLILALCDAFAALVGVAYGRISFVVEQGKKSIEGSVMFFLTAWLLAMMALLLLTGLPRDEVIIASLVIASFGTLLEGISWKGLDNLFIPFGLFLLTQRLLESSLAELVTTTAIFVAALAFAAWLSARAAQHTHAIMTVVTAVFFCWIAEGWATVLAPALVFAGYLVLRFRHEYEAGDGSELPVVFCIVSTALVWYVLSRGFGLQTYYAFNLSFGLHLVALIIVQDQRPSWLRWTAAILAGWAVANVRLLFIGSIDLHDASYSLIALGLLVLASLASLAARDWLLSQRWSKQAVLVVLATLPAMAVP